MASQPEKKNAKKWIDKITKKYNLWYARLADTPYISNKGIVNYKKPFDGILCNDDEYNLAIEWKYQKGIRFPFKKEWIEHKKKQHQFRNLLKFSKTNSGLGMLIVFFKVAGKRDLQKRFINAFEIEKKYKVGQTHLHYDEDMFNIEDLERYYIEGRV